jgi:outer membrane immunogenic protein
MVGFFFCRPWQGRVFQKTQIVAKMIFCDVNHVFKLVLPLPDFIIDDIKNDLVERRVMKPFILAATLFALITGSTFAADLPSRKAAIIAPPPPMWTGFYAGLNAGGTWSGGGFANVTTVGNNYPGNSAGSPLRFMAGATNNISGGSNSGFIGGGQIGYNWEVPVRVTGLIAGFEADIQGIAGSEKSFSSYSYLPGAGTYSGPIHTSTYGSGNLQYLGTVRGRLGYLFTPSFFIFGSGGLSYGGVSAALDVIQGRENANQRGGLFGLGAGNSSNTHVGWTAGGGIEYMFTSNWSAKVEYLYYDLGNRKINADYRLFSTNSRPLYLFTSQANIRFNGNIVRAGVNYHFNWEPAPVIASY